MTADRRAAPWREGLYDLLRLRKEALQLAQYVAVLSGLKRSMDDWIPGPLFEPYRSVIERMGLAMAIDCVFAPLPDTQRTFGLDWAPTTRSAGRPYDPREPLDRRSQVHVVVSSRPEWAAETLALAWYSLVVEGRVIYRPHKDFFRFGLALGYPECCVRFFMEHNDWPRQNTMAEAARVSRSLSWKANCLAKNSPWMLIFHMPCAFDCARTLEYSTSLIEEIRDFDRTYADTIEGFLKRTFLVVNERLVFALLGAGRGAQGRVRYEGADDLHKNMVLKDPRHEEYESLLAGGNELSVRDGAVLAWQDGTLTGSVETRCDQGVAEVPLILRFGNGLAGNCES